jgi:site-specific recombinase XerD
MKSEIYDYEERLERYKRIIRGLRNGELALNFLNHLGSFDLSVARISKYASHLPTLLRIIDLDPAEATREDVERFVAWINGQPYKEWTRHDLKLVLRKFIQYAKVGRCDRYAPLPEEVSWISLRVKEKDSRVTPDNLLSKEDFEAIIKATENPRDRAFVHVLFEAALRPGELLTMTVGSVEFKDRYCLITVNGKTGVKRIPLVVSFKPLLGWLKEHPNRDNPKAPLWCSLASNYKGEALSYKHFRLLIKRFAKKAGLRKEVWPYLFRHSTLTTMAKVFTEARLEQFAGWVHGSKMTQRYVHFSARDLEDAVLELHGLKEPDETGEIPRILVCPRCREQNPFGAVRCSFCGYILDRETAEKMEEEERRKDRKILERLERLENAISLLLSSPQAGFQPASSTQQSLLKVPRGNASQQPNTRHSYKTLTIKDLMVFKGRI